MKRFTETDKWTKDNWFAELDCKYKLFWLFIIDNCDNVGVWQVSKKMANFLIGYEYSMEEVLEHFGDKIYVFDDGKKWWIRSFVDFQHGALDEESQSKPIMSYIALLKKHTLYKEYTKGIQRVQGKGKGTGKGNTYPEDFDNAWRLYGSKGNKKQSLRYWAKLTKEDKLAIESNIPEYIKAKPEERFRKDFQGWINPANRMWENKIVASEPKKSSEDYVQTNEDRENMIKGYK